jgi:hypothetical protein
VNQQLFQLVHIDVGAKTYSQSKTYGASAFTLGVGILFTLTMGNTGGFFFNRHDMNNICQGINMQESASAKLIFSSFDLNNDGVIGNGLNTGRPYETIYYCVLIYQKTKEI